MRPGMKHAGGGRADAFFRGFTPAAHRGASREFPENTLEAFRRAREILPGCLLETDVRRTGDGAIVVIHDEMLELKTNGVGRVGDWPTAELLSLDAGYNITFDGGATYPFRGRGHRIPLLSEALSAFPGARFSIDIKDRDADAAREVVMIIAQHRASDRVIVGSFYDTVIRYVRKNFPHILTAYSRNETLRLLAARALGIPVFRKRGDALMVPEIAGGRACEQGGEGNGRGMRVITRRLIRAAHRRGIPVLAWTINRPENMRRLIDWGIDGIVTDRIDLLEEVMIEKGLLKSREIFH